MHSLRCSKRGYQYDESSSTTCAAEHSTANTIHLRPPGPICHLAGRHHPYPYPPQSARKAPPIRQSWHPIPRTSMAPTRTCVYRSDGKNRKLPKQGPISSITGCARRSETIRGRAPPVDRQSRRIVPSALQLGNAYDVHVVCILRQPQDAHYHMGRSALAVDRRRGRAALRPTPKVVYFQSQPSMRLIADAKRVRRGWVFEDNFAATMRFRPETPASA